MNTSPSLPTATNSSLNDLKRLGDDFYLFITINVSEVAQDTSLNNEVKMIIVGSDHSALFVSYTDI